MIKDRLLKGWTLGRVIYLIIGVAMIIQAANYDQWIGIVLGLYMSFMGLFGFGCAGGSCYNGSCDIQENQTKN
ncbi:hypothetical protein [Christiangramia crocea]|uniref:DUF2892 domain-containing protein n=1 Tax=Christiangramia crocea TaxID=2904124 RepID=A0A9X1UYW1_9FLAO|nr:hypothetical protein [Gramella crocea]MCG9972154.1 hypothetical protein [Gramella crocea]